MTDRSLQRVEAIEVHGMTRSAFILRGALGVGAACGAGAAGPFVRRALAQAGGDAEILNFALMLQYLEEDFYRQGLALGLAGDVKKLATAFRGHEQAHIETLTKAVTGAGVKPVKKPTFEFPIEDQKSFVALGMTLEDTGVQAFNGAGPKLTTDDALSGAGMIVQVEARHAAALRLAANEEPAPEAFDETIEMKDVLEAVKPFLKT